MRSVGLDEPLFVRRGEGAYLETEDGRRLVDWVQSWGPLLFGHADRRDGRGGTRGRARRDELRRRHAGRGRARRGDRRRRAVGRAGAARLVGHRGRDDGDPARARGHAPRPHPQVRRLLPRALGRAARERRLGPGHARDPLQPGRADARSPADTIVCPYNDLGRGRRGGRPLRRGARRDPRRAGGREHGRRPAGPGFLEALRRLCDACGRAARLRRGDHRLPRRPRRSAGAASACCPT